ncbi:unnamed protein product (macronuclear) [Paramecium tetraurelia]|uniref:Uncharacterized protein n=1 Tax=Paramecium tetraurelia TaxID=5888 RepID=A0CMR1_PARTE|nr:uncharacterized protein GSPATT00008557001 [Paramecium tetraurelia]CAK72078.1 unnamed protein product [Paramecium tetraurelia]|eukprot:XP_001439475.1 hypothetical protein (macronuclear) [Paramecium tetraurelia strain d4-2]
MQISNRSIEDYKNHNYTNKLLLKASNIHMKPNETISPIRKKSMMDSNIPSIYNETDRMTDRIRLQMREKNKSCCNMPDEDISDSPFQKYSQFVIMNQNVKQLMIGIEKKLKNFKFAKENDHNSCASIIAKMKCFCLDNCCFDFYRCTDLILLKYLIYLLIQELNSNKIGDSTSCLSDQPPPQLKNLIKDAIAIMHETVEELKNKQLIDKNSNKSIDQLNKQIKKMQQVMGGSNQSYDVFTTPQSNIKKIDLFLKQQSATQKREINQTSPSLNSEKIIQFQIDELSMKNDQIQKLNGRIKDQEQEIKILTQQIAEANLSLQISQKSLQNKESEMKDLIKKTDKLLETTSQALKDKEAYQNTCKSIKQDHDQLKTLFDDLQKSNQSIIQEYHVLRQSQNDSQDSDMQKYKSDEERYKQDRELLDKNNKQLKADGLALGSQLKDISNKIMQVSPDLLPKSLQQLQRDLYLQESKINEKLNNIQYVQLEQSNKPNSMQKLQQKQIVNQNQNQYLNQYQNQNQQFEHQLKSIKSHSDIMTMILIQCEVIEKFIN